MTQSEMLNNGWTQLQCPDCKDWSVWTKGSATVLCACPKVTKLDYLLNQEIELNRKLKNLLVLVDLARDSVRKNQEEILKEKVKNGQSQTAE